ncbi:nucleotidyltransferase family protein [Bacillus timonensis]|nr:nucleotidyltransferase family protein [Bacillus timonensis]
MIMSIVERLYTKEDFLVGNENEYIGLLSDIEVFAIKSQVYHLLQSRTQTESVTKFLTTHLKDSYQRASYQNLMLRHELGSLLVAFESEFLPVIPLKGVIFSESYFGDFAARGTADLDLLIRPSDLKKAIHLVKEYGFQTEEAEDLTNNHCTFIKNENGPLPISVELHWNLDKEYFSDLNHDTFWENSEAYADYKYVRVLSKKDTFYYTCLHAARHKMDSLKYFIDLIQIISKFPAEIDFTELRNRAKQDKTWRKVNAVLTILYREFQFLHAIKPYSLQTKFVIWSKSSARRAHTGRKNIEYYLYKFYFNKCIFDLPKHLFTSMKWFHYIYPPKNYLNYFLAEDSDCKSKWYLLKQYYLFYLQNLLKYQNRKNREERI